ncbi:MAG: ATP-binding cassette family protein, partial [Cyanobacteria bacterium J083]
MIPLQLKLKNFLSYRHATLDFRGLHTACICGANGAGKSSLLEAITWAVWGKSRAASDDDIINAAATSVRVDFEFQINQQVYRIIRSRSQGKSSKLEFQVLQESGHFLPITAKGLRSTEKKIIETIKLDYDTFVNSAYLRQGRADEFMLRRASERKQVLADLLKLDRYEVLANRAKDEAKQYKGKLELLEESLEPIKVKLAEKKLIEAQQKTIESDLQQLQTIQAKQKKRLRELQALDQQRKIWQQQLSREQLQYENSRQDCDRLRQDISKAEDKLAELKEILEQSKEIKHGYQYFNQLKAEEAELSVKFPTYQQLEA